MKRICSIDGRTASPTAFGPHVCIRICITVVDFFFISELSWKSAATATSVAVMYHVWVVNLYLHRCLTERTCYALSMLPLLACASRLGRHMHHCVCSVGKVAVYRDWWPHSSISTIITLSAHKHAHTVWVIISTQTCAHSSPSLAASLPLPHESESIRSAPILALMAACCRREAGHCKLRVWW